MHIARRNTTELVVEDGSLWLAFAFAGGAFVCACMAIAKVEYKELIGSLLCLLFSAGFARHTTFRFDATEQMVRWRMRTFLKVQTGSIAFGQIHDVVLDAMSGQHGALTYRLVIATSEGQTPMANEYGGGGEERYEKLRSDIMGFVGLDPARHVRSDAQAMDGIPPEIEASLREMVGSGRTIDAIALLRSREKIGLADAKDRVDRLRVTLTTKV